MEAIVRQKQAEQDSEKEDEDDDLGGSGEIALQMVNDHSTHFYVVFSPSDAHPLTDI